eukprot:scaffold24459_cov88-Cylindrotheca_fusiformis.AAC.1
METSQLNHPTSFAKPMMGEALQRLCSVVVYLQSANSYLSFLRFCSKRGPKIVQRSEAVAKLKEQRIRP